MLVGQVSWSHHWMVVDGQLLRHSAPYRFLWPSELDLMGKMAGLRLTEHWASWSGQPFSSESPQQIAVFKKVAPDNRTQPTSSRPPVPGTEGTGPGRPGSAGGERWECDRGGARWPAWWC
jgi:hypothetical protein